tara:strand:+ start:8585 stop:8785 length:201 start_codon:yes stop_codon:yes gene_type:complete
MNIYLINNNKDNQKFEKKFKCMEDAKNWVINTLDLSKNWNILLIDDEENLQDALDYKINKWGFNES